MSKSSEYMANRECCDLVILSYADKTPFMNADFCNTTTSGISRDAVYAKKKGVNDIKFDNAPEGTITMEFQVSPFKVYAMLSDGEIETTAVIARHETITVETAGTVETSYTADGDVYIYEEGDFGGTQVEASKTVAGTTYEVFYFETKTSGVKKVSFNREKVPKFFYIQMATYDKNENGDLVPVRITAYKCSPQETFDMSFASEGDPQTVTITFDLMEDSDGNFMDMIEITDETE